MNEIVQREGFLTANQRSCKNVLASWENMTAVVTIFSLILRLLSPQNPYWW